MKKYPLQKKPLNLSESVQIWLRKMRGLALLEIRSAAEIRLTPLPTPGEIGLATEDRPGCTVLVQGDSLHIRCAASCQWIESKLIGFLRTQGLVGKGECLSDCPRLSRRKIVHDHQMGRPVSEKVLERVRAERAAKRAMKPGRFRSVIDALRAAADIVGPWMVFTQRALDSAVSCDYRDPDYIYELLVELGRAAELNASGGLDGDWKHHLGTNGGHDFVANTSKNTVAMFYEAYHVTHGGRPVCIGAHVRCGVGSGQDLVRIYFALPDQPGSPLILGHVGKHLPLPGRK